MVLSDASSNNYINVLNYTETSNPSYANSTWYNDLFFQDISFNNGFITLSSFATNLTSEAILTADQPVGDSLFTPIGDSYKTFYLIPQTNGITDVDDRNAIVYTLRENIYTKNQILQEINAFFSSNQFTQGSTISLLENGGRTTTQVRLNIDKTFRAYDYNLVFYSPYNVPVCNAISPNNLTTWDTCLGWILGFKQQTQYSLSQYWDFTTNTARLTGNSVLSIYLYNTLMIVIDEFAYNRHNDSVVAIARRTGNPQDNTIPTTYESFNQTNVSTRLNYGLNRELNAQTPAQNLFSPGVFLKDVFAIIPIDVSQLRINDVYVQIASVLQDQKREYFGTKNISRMRIALYTNTGQILNLNQSDWSFQILAEQLYNPTK
jgi:hypothetical protein